MFFLFGFGQQIKDVGPGEYRTCPRCNNHTQWRQIQICQRFTLFFIPIISWGHTAMEQCTICSHNYAPENSSGH